MVRAPACRSRGRTVVRFHLRRFEAWAISFTPLCPCLSEETLKAVGPNSCVSSRLGCLEYNYLRLEIHTYVYTYIRINIHTYVYTYIHTYIRIYIHIYVYTCIHTYIHIYRPQRHPPKQKNTNKTLSSRTRFCQSTTFDMVQTHYYY